MREEASLANAACGKLTQEQRREQVRPVGAGGQMAVFRPQTGNSPAETFVENGCAFVR